MCAYQSCYGIISCALIEGSEGLLQGSQVRGILMQVAAELQVEEINAAIRAKAEMYNICDALPLIQNNMFPLHGLWP